MKREHQYIPSLHGLRTVSIVFVLLLHLALTNSSFRVLHENRFSNFLLAGHLGVNIFFVISGFLITTLLLIEEKKHQRIDIKEFYIRRLFRIFPPYYALLLFYLIAQHFHYVSIGKESFITAFTYFKYLNWKNDWFTTHAWSLSIEEQFYMLWPFCFLLKKRARTWLLGILILEVPFLRLARQFYNIEWMNDLIIFMRIDAIAIGCLLAMYKDEILQKIKPHLSWLALVSLIGLVFIRAYHDFFQDEYINLFFIFIGPVHGSVANIFIAIIVLYSVFQEDTIWFRFLNLKPVVWLGTMSYGIYLWQQFYIAPLDGWIHQFPQNIVLTVLTAYLSYMVIESPFLKLRNKFSQRRNINN